MLRHPPEIVVQRICSGGLRTAGAGTRRAIDHHNVELERVTETVSNSNAEHMGEMRSLVPPP